MWRVLLLCCGKQRQKEKEEQNQEQQAATVAMEGELPKSEAQEWV